MHFRIKLKYLLAFASGFSIRYTAPPLSGKHGELLTFLQAFAGGLFATGLFHLPSSSIQAGLGPKNMTVTLTILENGNSVAHYSHQLPSAIADALALYESTGNAAPTLTAEAEILDESAEITVHAGPFTFTPYKVPLAGLSFTAEVTFA